MSGNPGAPVTEITSVVQTELVKDKSKVAPRLVLREIEG